MKAATGVRVAGVLRVVGPVPSQAGSRPTGPRCHARRLRPVRGPSTDASRRAVLFEFLDSDGRSCMVTLSTLC